MASHAYSDILTQKRNAKGRNKPRDAEKTLAEIMDVAEGLFASYGYEGTSLRQVAVGVNMSQPNFYNYFSSKEKLYESVLARSLAPLMTVIKDGISQTASNASFEINDDIAYQVIDTFMDQLTKNRNLAGLIYQESINGSETVSRLSKGMFEGILEESALGLDKSNKGAWPKDQIPFLVVAWFNLIFGYFASASLMKNILPDSHAPMSTKGLQTQRLFLKNVWDKLMKS